MAIPNNVKEKVKDAVGEFLGLDFPGGLFKQPPPPPDRNKRPQYTLVCNMGDIELSNRLERISIINSIVSVYPLFFIEFKIDAKDAFLNKIYGHETLNLHISVCDSDGNPIEENAFEIVIVDIKLPMTTKPADQQPQPQQEELVKIVGIVKTPFLVMTTPINYILEPQSKGTGSNNQASQSGNQTLNISNISNELNSVINSITSSIGAKNLGKFNIPQVLGAVTSNLSKMNFGSGNTGPSGNSTSNLNTKNGTGGSGGSGRRAFDLAKNMFEKFIPDGKINAIPDNCIEDSFEHMTIPPKTYCGAIRYLDDIYGIFKGPMFNYCRWENNTYCLWDLTKAINMPEDYTVEFLAIGQDSKEIMAKSGVNEGVFCTYSPLTCTNNGNKNVIQKGHSQVFIKKNLHTFFEKIESSVEDIAKDGIGDGGKSLVFNEVLKRRKSVFTKSLTGGVKNSENDGLKSKIASMISSSSNFSFALKGYNLPLTKLNRVGGCIKLNPHVPEYINYNGKYIVATSIFCISRDDELNYIGECLISCFRQNVEV